MTDKDDDKQFNPVWVMSNEPTEFKVRTIELFYQSLAYGQIGYMDGKDEETGEIVPLLIAIRPLGEDRFEIFPLARLLMSASDNVNFLVPNGLGEYTKPDTDNAVDFSGAELAPFERDDDGGEEEAGEAEGLDKEAAQGTLH